jgi:hypothetical protein
MALNLLRQETTSKGGIKTKQLRPGWDEDYIIEDYIIEDYLIEDYLIEDYLIEDYLIEDYLIKEAILMRSDCPWRPSAQSLNSQQFCMADSPDWGY